MKKALKYGAVLLVGAVAGAALIANVPAVAGVASKLKVD